MRINFDFGDLEAFLAVFETGSFHLASRQIGLSQSAITRRVQKLEEALGSNLFERTTRAVRATLAAKRLYTRAQALLSDAEETTIALRDESLRFLHQRNTLVTVACVPSLLARLIVPAVQDFKQGAPNARVRILDQLASDLADAVGQGDADFGIGPVPMQSSNCQFDILFEEPFVLAVPTGHRLAGQDSTRWSDLQGEDLLLPLKGTGNRLLIDDALAKARMPLHWTYEVRRSTTALEMVATGLGLAPVPLSAMTGQRGDLHGQICRSRGRGGS